MLDNKYLQTEYKNKKIYSVHTHIIFLFLILIASTFQYGDYIVSRYFVPFVATLLTCIYFIVRNISLDSKEKTSFFIHIGFYFLFVINSFMGLASAEEFLFDIIKLYLSFFISFVVYYLVKNTNIKTVLQLLNYMLISAIIFLTLDLFYRITPFLSNFHVVYSQFYVMKVNSIFMVDSNAVALYALFYFALILSLYNINCNIYRKNNILLAGVIFIFIVFTFSRSAIITAILLYGLFFYNKLSKSMKKILIIILPFILAIIIYFTFIYVLSDASGLTKLNVISNTFNLIPTKDIQGFIFGFGINEGNYAYSYIEGAYSHLLIPMLLGQFGVIGLILYLSFFYLMYKLSSGKTYLLIIAMLVSGLSYLHPFLETIFLVNGIVVGIHQNRSL